MRTHHWQISRRIGEQTRVALRGRLPRALVLATLAWGLGGCGAAPPPAPPPEWVSQADPEFLDQLAATYRFRLGQPRSIEVFGGRIYFLQSGPRSFEQALYAYDPASRETREVLTAARLLGVGAETLTAEEQARRERLRLAARGIARYTLSRESGRILVLLSGRPFVYDLKSDQVFDVLGPAAAPVQDAHLSPDGARLAFVRGGTVSWIPVEGGQPSPLSPEGQGDTLTHGLAEFVAQEEMERLEGLWWSPGGRALAWQRTDVRQVERFVLSSLTDPAQPPAFTAYPRPGKANADVRLFAQALGKPPVEVVWDRAAHPYLARVGWVSEDALWFITQNRRQTELSLRRAKAPGWESEVVLTETDPAWVSLEAQLPTWAGEDQFLWISERSGARQLELRGADGAVVRSLTPPGFRLTRVIHGNPLGGRVVIAGGPDPTQEQLFRVELQEGSPIPLTDAVGQHGLRVGEDGLTVHEHTPERGPTTWQVRWMLPEGLGHPVGALQSRAERPRFEPQVTWQSVEVAGRVHHTQVVRPRGFDPRWRYPVVHYIYGGPTHAMVRRSAEGALLDQWIADHGFIVVRADGRATPGRDRDWQRAQGPDLAAIPLEDARDILKALGAALPELDLDRVALYGWSFGGYLAAMGTLRMPDVFRAGVAGAPVADWLDYDTHYTERYLGLPDTEAEAYRRSSVLTYAAQLERPLMIIHGTGDDNVYFAHALKLSDALLRAEKPHDFIVLAGHSHMVSDAAISRGQYGRILQFFRHHLGPPRLR